MLVWCVWNGFNGDESGMWGVGVVKMGGYSNAGGWRFASKGVGDFEPVCPQLLRGVEHSDDEFVYESYYAGVVIMPGMQPLRDIDDITSVEELSRIGVFIRKSVPSGFVVVTDALGDVVSSSVPFDFGCIDSPVTLGMNTPEHVKPQIAVVLQCPMLAHGSSAQLSL